MNNNTFESFTTQAAIASLNLFAATIHLQTHCDEDLQDLISQELENT